MIRFHVSMRWEVQSPSIFDLPLGVMSDEDITRIHPMINCWSYLAPIYIKPGQRMIRYLILFIILYLSLGTSCQCFDQFFSIVLIFFWIYILLGTVFGEEFGVSGFWPAPSVGRSLLAFNNLVARIPRETCHTMAPKEKSPPNMAKKIVTL